MLGALSVCIAMQLGRSCLHYPAILRNKDLTNDLIWDWDAKIDATSVHCCDCLLLCISILYMCIKHKTHDGHYDSRMPIVYCLFSWCPICFSTAEHWNNSSFRRLCDGRPLPSAEASACNETQIVSYWKTLQGSKCKTNLSYCLRVGSTHRLPAYSILALLMLYMLDCFSCRVGCLHCMQLPSVVTNTSWSSF